MKSILSFFCLPALLLSGACLLSAGAFAQSNNYYSDKELWEAGHDAYVRGDFRAAGLCLFAYAQRNPHLYATRTAEGSDFLKVLDALLRGGPPTAHAKGDEAGSREARRSLARPDHGTSFSLAGKWSCNDGGTYYVEQRGSDIWWLGQSRDGGRGFSNIFHGEINGSVIIGKWSDVPKGAARNGGRLVLVVEDNQRMKTHDESGGFGGSAWSR